MTRKDFDARDFSKSRVTDTRRRALDQAAKDVSEKLPGNWTVKIQNLDNTTGRPSELVSESAPTTEKGNYIQRALNFLNSVKPAQGFEENQAAEFKPDPIIQKTSANAKAVHVQQTIGGIPIFQAGMTVRFDPNDAIEGAVGNTVTFAEISEVSPKLSAKDAVMIVAKHLAEPDADEQQATDQFGEPLIVARVDLTGFEPKADVTMQSDPSKTTFFEQGPFASRIRANMLWFELAPNDVRLTWEVTTTMPNFAGQYSTIVDANTGEVLYNQQIMLSLRARMNVYRVNGGMKREMVECPLRLDGYPLSKYSPPTLPTEFPDEWCDDHQMSVGNSTYAHLGDSGEPIQANVRNGIITFDPADPTGDEQKVLNIFYLNCYMHDYFYLLGFRELEANFQQDNFGRGGIPSDRVDARSHPQAVFGTANMGRSVEGESPVMNMGLVTSTNRHTAFDSDVVFHEFTHGVANRLVGGGTDRNSLQSPQSGCFNEGNSDYFACTVNKKVTCGDWVVNNPRGIRKHSYDSNFPHNFGQLGTVTDGINYSEVHNGGEIWCATVLEMNRNIGDELGAQLVVDALKIVQVTPSFLNMRDSILTALDHKLTANPPMDRSEHKNAWNGIWKAFAKFGMGPNAQSNGAQLFGIRADFSVPTHPQG